MSQIKDFTKIFSASGISMLLGLVTTPIITRLVMPEDYGNWSIFYTFSNVISAILILGFDQVLVRYCYSYTDTDYQKALVKKCWIYPLIFHLIALIPTLYFINTSVTYWSFTMCLIWSVYIFILSLNRLCNVLLRFTDKINSLSWYTIANKALFVVLSIILITWGGHDNFYNLVLASVLTILFISIGMFFQIRKLCVMPSKGYTFPISNKELFSYGIPLMFAGGVFLLFQATAKIMIKSMCNDTELGIFASALSLISIIAIIQSSFTTIWWPTVMKKYEEEPDNHSFYINACDTISFIMLLVGSILILSKDFLVLLLGENFHNAVDVLPFMLFQPILYTISETTVLGLIFKKKSKHQLYISMIALISNIALNYILIPLIGIVGAALSSSLSFMLFFALRTFLANKAYKIKLHYRKLIISILALFSLSIVATYSIFTYSEILVGIFVISFISLLYRNVIKNITIQILKYTK